MSIECYKGDTYSIFIPLTRETKLKDEPRTQQLETRTLKVAQIQKLKNLRAAYTHVLRSKLRHLKVK